MENYFHLKIANWKLALLALLFFCLFVSLGCWQLSRAHHKKQLLQSFSKRMLASPLQAPALKSKTDLRFYQATLTGTFDNQHTFLLDNKIFYGKVGYQVYTPFYAEGVPQPILIDRGFIPIGPQRQTLPTIRPLLGTITLTGLLNTPPAYFAFGPIHETAQPHWPLRIQFVNLTTLSTLLGHPLFPYLLSLPPDDPSAYAMEWQITVMPPEKHIGYAIQWFALALTLLILFVLLNCQTHKQQ